MYQPPHEAAQRFILHYGDMTDATSLVRVVHEVQPDEIYNLAAKSHVAVSFETPDDYVIATGISDSVREFVEIAGRKLDMDIHWQDAGTDEVGVVGFKAAVRFVRPEMDGAPRELMDSGRLAAMGWRSARTLEQRLAETYVWHAKYCIDKGEEQ